MWASVEGGGEEGRSTVRYFTNVRAHSETSATIICKLFLLKNNALISLRNNFYDEMSFLHAAKMQAAVQVVMPSPSRAHMTVSLIGPICLLGATEQLL